MVSNTLDRWLQPGVMLRKVYERMVPNLIFMDMVTTIPEENPTFHYSYESYSMSTDPKKKTPPKAKIGSLFPELDYTRESVSSAATRSNGFGIRLKYDLLKKRKTMAQEIEKANLRAGFWMAEYINSAILTAMEAGKTTPTWTPTATWDSATATPITDLEKFGEQFAVNEGYPYRFTDAYVEKTNWHELHRYVLDYDNRYLVGGAPKVDRDTIYIPSLGLKVHKLWSGISEGTLFGIDANNPVAEYHYFIDTEYGTTQVKYETVENDKTTSKTVSNFGIHFDKVQEANKDIVMQYWYDATVVVTNAYGILEDTGI